MLEQITLMYTDHMMARGCDHMLGEAGYDCKVNGCEVVITIHGTDDLAAMLKLVTDSIE